MGIEVIMEDERWSEAGLEALAPRAAAAAFAHLALEGLDAACLGTDDARIAALNAEFRGKQAPTNVLSWPAEDLAPEAPGAVPPPPADPEIGDIALAYDTARRKPRRQALRFPITSPISWSTASCIFSATIMKPMPTPT